MPDWRNNERTRRIVGQSGRLSTGVIATIGGCTAAILGLREVFNLRGPMWANILVAYLCLMVAASLISLVVQDRWRSRRSRYAIAAASLHSSYHHLRDLSACIERRASAEDFAPRLDDALTAFAKAFSIITAVDCRATVKSLYSEEGTLSEIDPTDEPSLRPLKVRTLSRDKGSQSSIGVREETGDYVTDNTDYEQLILARFKDRYFFANDLRKVNPYKNSHWQDQAPREYFATIVWPIQKKEQGGATARIDLEGFLAVDTLTAGAFRSRFDPEVGAAFADTLFTVLKRWRTVADPKQPGAMADHEQREIDLRQAEGKTSR